MAITVTVNALDTVDTRLAIYRAELVLNVNLAGSAVIVAKAGLLLYITQTYILKNWTQITACVFSTVLHLYRRMCRGLVRPELYTQVFRAL